MRRWNLFWAVLFLLNTLLNLMIPTAVGAYQQPGLRPKDDRVRPLDELLVSLEWVPSNMPLSEELLLAGCGPVNAPGTYLDDLELGLRRMADYIYQFIDRRVALRTITIDVTGADWDRADIRILASQSLRPSAHVGGNTTVPVRVDLGADAPTLVLRPAPIQVGRFWNGQGARCGPWSSLSGYRTLAHEWAHYALRLYDEYIQHPHNHAHGYGNAYCESSTRQRTIMAYHYEDIIHPLSDWTKMSPPASSCLGTPQHVVYGEDALTTLERFFVDGGPIVGHNALSSSDLAIIPNSTLSGPDPITVLLDALGHFGVSTAARWPAPSYVLWTDTDDRLRIMGQGNLIAGASPGRVWPGLNGPSRLVVTTQEPNSGLVFSYPPAHTGAHPLPSGRAVLTAQPGAWNTAVAIHPLLSATDPLTGALGLAVDLTVCDNSDRGENQPGRFAVTYCPTGGPCLPFQPAHLVDAGTLIRRATIPVKPSASGYVYVIDYLRNSEVVLWHQLAGGVGPAHSDGLAPRAEGLLNLDVVANLPVDSPNPSVPLNELSYTPELACPSEAQISPSAVFRLADLPLRVTLATTTVTTSTVPFWNETPLGVRLNYNADELSRRGIAEDSLVVLQRVNGSWQILSALGHDQDLDWIAARLVLSGGKPGSPAIWTDGGQTLGEDGVVALGYVPSAPGLHSLYLPVVRK
ncbi:MAG TPA: hypothetical protein VFS21_34220 [Roseiflexaceae bacterium]|nr:hypothetical protein [Roseiflexaceae bacterium]